MHFIEIEPLLTEAEARALGLVLASAGILYSLRPSLSDDEAAAGAGAPSHWSLAVLHRQVDEARALIAEERATAAPELADAAEPAPLLGRKNSSAWVIGLILVNVLIWQALERAGGSTRHDVLLRFGAITAERLKAGQWWRSITAVFLHIGSTHLVANCVVLLVLGLLALRSWGPGRMLFLFVAAGCGGNWVGYVFGDPLALKAGASGAILGLLGGLAGARLRELLRRGQRSRYRLWHIPAMVLAFYGLVIGVSPESDHVAHIGGLLTGTLVALGWPLPGSLSLRGERTLQWLLAAAALVASALAAYLALSAR
ncbi:MAG: rhomboid family intramembrane serine protease [Proteobacteria bacterium]|nr:rhomboid family intramembrane serine protease [Pseudomonadota bacterium]